jgi:hypothetical protein
MQICKNKLFLNQNKYVIYYLHSILQIHIHIQVHISILNINFYALYKNTKIFSNSRCSEQNIDLHYIAKEQSLKIKFKSRNTRLIYTFKYVKHVQDLEYK